MTTQITITDYYDLLSNFDWTYQYSDDHKVYMQRSKEHTELLGYRSLSDNHKRLYDDFIKGGSYPDINDYKNN